MGTKKILGIIFSCVFILVFGLVLTWGIMNFNKVKEAMSGSQIYTQEDLNNAYQDGYNTACDNKEEYEAMIISYRDRIAVLTAQLESSTSSYEDIIRDLNKEVKSLSDSLSHFENSSISYTNQIANLNNRIKSLEESISYYEGYMKSLESDNKAIVTFIYDSTVYEFKTVTKGSTVSISNPESTSYKIFNGWLNENGNVINLEDFVIDSNITFIADITYKYDVKFISNDKEIYNQILLKDECCLLPADPDIPNWDFLGWSVDGESIISKDIIATTPVTEHITYTAIFVKKYVITFVSNSQIISSQAIVENDYVTLPAAPVRNGYTFLGWSKDGLNVISKDIINQTPVIEDITYTALWENGEYKFSSSSFISYSNSSVPLEMKEAMLKKSDDSNRDYLENYFSSEKFNYIRFEIIDNDIKKDNIKNIKYSTTYKSVDTVYFDTISNSNKIKLTQFVTTVKTTELTEYDDNTIVGQLNNDYELIRKFLWQGMIIERSCIFYFTVSDGCISGVCMMNSNVNLDDYKVGETYSNSSSDLWQDIINLINIDVSITYKK